MNNSLGTFTCKFVLINIFISPRDLLISRRIAESMVTLCLTFRETARLSSKLSAPLYIPLGSVCGSPFSTSLRTPVIIWLYHHPSLCEVVSHDDFYFIYLILWSPDAKSQLLRKDPDAGKDWGQEENGAIKDEMVGWHHQLNEHKFEQTPGVSEGQRSLACCGPWGHRVRHDWATKQQQQND